MRSSLPQTLTRRIHALRGSYIHCNSTVYARLYYIADGIFSKYPLIGGSLFASFKGISADIFVQTQMEKKNKNQFDFRRTLFFGLFGFFYCGMFQYALYAKLYPFLFPNVSFQSVTTQILTDVFIHASLIYFPVFYCSKYLFLNPRNSEKYKDRLKGALSTYYYENFYGDMDATMKFWIPTQALTFTVIPYHLRVPYIASIAFVWMGIVSYLRGESG